MSDERGTLLFFNKTLVLMGLKGKDDMNRHITVQLQMDDVMLQWMHVLQLVNLNSSQSVSLFTSY